MTTKTLDRPATRRKAKMLARFVRGPLRPAGDVSERMIQLGQQLNAVP